MRNLLIIVIMAIFLVSVASSLVLAQEADPFSALTYPIKELGGCTSRNACEVYCEKPTNMKACLDFAETHSLLPEEEIEMGQRMLALGQTTGPGGCRGQVQCEVYCDNIDHIKECITFAEKHNLIPQEELGDAKKVLAAMEKGLKPPKCKHKKDCDVYCSAPENMEECITFGEAAGLIPPGELQDAKKSLEAIKKGVKPPKCMGKAECDVYCSSPEHMEECINFGIAAGFMPPEELKNAKKTLEALKQGIKPPNCRGKEECDVYCQTPEHIVECMEFGIATGSMPPEDLENAKRTLEAIKKGVMPPNCRGEEECKVYCQQPEHQQECINFAEATGAMSPEEAEQTKKMLEFGVTGGPGSCQGEEACRQYCEDPAHLKECLYFYVKMGDITPEEAQEIMKNIPSGMPQVGPGGCKTPEECEAYCSDPSHLDECMQVEQMPGEMMPPSEEEMFEEQPQPQYPMPPQQFSPPDNEMAPQQPPQSFLNPLKLFLGSILKVFEF